MKTKIAQRTSTTPTDAAAMKNLRDALHRTTPYVIYGINFNGMPIPEAYKRKFAAETSAKGLLPNAQRGERFYLQGVAGDAQSRDAMLIQAHNGHRHLHVVERKTAGVPCYGIYVG